METLIKNLQKKVKVNLPIVKRAATDTCVFLRRKKRYLSIYFVSNETIRKLNKQFFKKDNLTDVISFGLGDNLAEVFVAPLVAKNNSKKYGVKFQEEILRCVVHGILHVFGFTDSTKSKKDKMWKKQELILNSLMSNIK